MAGNLLNYLWLVHYPTYVHTTTRMPLRSALLASMIAITVSLLIIPFVGILADRIGRKPVLLAFALGSMLFAWPSLALVENDFGRILLLQTIAMVLLSGFAATCAAVMAEQFPAEVRAAGVGFPYAVSVTLFGGTAPYVTLVSWTYGNYTCVYVAAVCAVGAIVYARMPKTKGIDLGRPSRQYFGSTQASADRAEAGLRTPQRRSGFPVHRWTQNLSLQRQRNSIVTRCREEVSALRPIGDGIERACHRAEELQLPATGSQHTEAL